VGMEEKGFFRPASLLFPRRWGCVLALFS